ncbi:hypothetical protein CGI03_09425 [Vibrio parahaemolyticus]|uniref:hypothetical protein n=2 Tax=Vibrio parahaemolyticus TaxID=670 RepID=UPI0006A5DF00|nr:hypothetical protein [Vibrio parahaemolyticus]EGR3113866.1 hypothetical protein [Vibrio parahaemolyticus]EHH1220214.1 hypothetical protein [Vibrio parahaemolyticus]EJG1641874.1 hypothetical protein [Vibrio parahaemolyticus]ELA8139742.1 hypothetical protein [Vibrio parahaemolyticus]ELA9310200.1 hypothetical protein [Vibrio parahaemolyticus]
MALTVLKNPIDSFWHDQNLKLTVNPFFMSEQGDVYSDIWRFKAKSNCSTTTLDFSWFDLPVFNHEAIATYLKDGHDFPLNAKEYAKLVCLSVISPTSTENALLAYQMMRHLFAFLKENSATSLTVSSLESFWTSFMGRTVNQYGFVNRISTPAYRGAIAQVQFHKVRNNLKALGVVGVIDHSLTKKKIEKSLDDVCQSQYSTTLAEFKKGGSFNFLGLELGQYYVDYLNQVYQNDFLYASVCRLVFESIDTKYGMKSLDYKLSNGLREVMLIAILRGVEYKPAAHRAGINFNALAVEVKDALFEEYSKRFELVTSLKDQSIEALVIELGLSSRSDSVELIRVLMLKKYLGLEGHKTSHEVWQGYLLSLDKTFLEAESFSQLSVDDVYEKMQAIVSKQRLGRESFLADIGAWANKQLSHSEFKTYKSFKAILNIPLYAMTNLVVAWTGYRQSEFGFPLSAIHSEPNLDILDNAHVPFRFKLKWLVPKTGGSTKINREITSQCYQVAAQLNEVFGHEGDEPCLYSYTGKAKKENVNQSETYINARVKANWEGFVRAYQPFNDVIKLDTLNGKHTTRLTIDEQKELELLSVKYSIGSARYKNLLSCAQEVKKDWLRLSCTTFNSVKAHNALKGSLILFSKGEPLENTKHQEIIETYLSDETKALLTSGSVDLNDTKTMMDIVSELLEGVRYPSPHAFRHIWAESVLTRYQGDVGAVIRHQFAHLDNSFFMAYLRDKDVRGLMQSAKQRYLNSLVELLIIESEQIGEKYVGGLAQFVKKATSLTQVKDDNRMLALREAVSGRIIDIQVNPFATCIPRDGADSRAKCSKMGSLNPQDAKPEFCLNCTNALITEGNIKGIWQVIQPMVKEALQEHAFGFLLEAHLPTLKSSWKRIKELRNEKNADSVDKILAAITKAMNAIESKVKEEEELYA